MPPPPLSPFPAAAEGEESLISLHQWWLATVEGDDQKVALAGRFEWKRRLYELPPVLIAKRLSFDLVESEDGTAFHISGFLNKTRTLGYGYSNTVFEDFMYGFPPWWQSCKLHYPKMRKLESGYQPCPCYTSNSERYTSKDVNNIKKGLVMGSPSRQRGHEDIATGVSLAPTVECTNNTVSEAIDSTPATECKKTPVASLKSQGSQRENPHTASNSKVLRSALTRGQATLLSMSTPEALKLKRTRSGREIVPELDEGCQSIVNRRPVGRPKKEISPHEKPLSATSHDDIATDVCLDPTVEYTSNAVSEAVDNTPATDCKKTPVASLKCQGYRRENQLIASTNKPVGRPNKKISPHEKRQSGTRSPGTRSPVSHVLWSPLTRGKATSLSMSTPEALKLKRTRSGRMIVPKLDEGCQSIVYGRDGLIAAVIGLDPPAMPK